MAALDIPIPKLVPVADLVASVGVPLEVRCGSGNVRRVIPILGGEVSGSRLRGRVLPGGTDFQLLRTDGVTQLEARYVIETAEGVHIYVENTGIRFGPAELMEKLRRGEPVDPGSIYFRATPRFETASPDYQWLTQSLFLCSGARYPDRVELRFFQVG